MGVRLSMAVKDELLLIYKNAVHVNTPDCKCARCDISEMLVLFMAGRGFPIPQNFDYKLAKQIIGQIPQAERIGRLIRNSEGKFKGNDHIEEVRASAANEHRTSMKKMPVRVCRSCRKENPTYNVGFLWYCNKLCASVGY